MTLWFICQAPWWCQPRWWELIQMSSRGLSSVKRESVLPPNRPNPRCVLWLCWPITEAVCSADHASSQHALTDACVLSLMQECILTALIQVFEWQLWVLVKHFRCRLIIPSVCSGPHPDSWSSSLLFGLHRGNMIRSLYTFIHLVPLWTKFVSLWPKHSCSASYEDLLAARGVKTSERNACWFENNNGGSSRG